MTPDELRDATCTACPAQVLNLGEFDVHDGPDARYRYSPTLGMRVDVDTHVPVCVHPFRVGLPAGCYASRREPLPPVTAQLPLPEPVQLELPEQVDDLEAWLIATLRVTPAERMASALRDAEATAAARFDAKAVVTVMRRVLAYELRD